MCLFLYVIQWGPALYLCYKRAVVKANALVYEAGECHFFFFFWSLSHVVKALTNPCASSKV